jgi:hypothetical protein
MIQNILKCILLLSISITVNGNELNTQQMKGKRMEFQGELELTARTSDEVAKRALALLAMVSRVHESNIEGLNKWVVNNKIENYFTAQEKTIFYQEELSHGEKVEYSWRAESLVSLLWSLNIIDHYPSLNSQADIYSYKSVLDAINDPLSFLSSAKLRSIKEIEDKESELYHQHWRVRDAELFNKPMPPELDPGIVYERRYGLSWVVGWGDDWEDVPTDT